MKGLLVKDFQLILVNKKLLYMIVMFVVFFAFTMNDRSFVTSFCIMMFEIIALSTLSYDSFNNGNAFLFTLPIKRKDYVIEKYIFISLMCLAGLICSAIISVIFEAVSGEKGDLLLNVAFAIAFLAFVSIAIPFELKFGSESGKIIPAIIVAACFLIFQIIKKVDVLVDGKISTLFMNMAERIDNLNQILFVILEIMVALIVIGISMAVSIKVINKKEF